MKFLESNPKWLLARQVLYYCINSGPRTGSLSLGLACLSFPQSLEMMYIIFYLPWVGVTRLGGRKNFRDVAFSSEHVWLCCFVLSFTLHVWLWVKIFPLLALSCTYHLAGIEWNEFEVFVYPVLTWELFGDWYRSGSKGSSGVLERSSHHSFRTWQAGKLKF